MKIRVADYIARHLESIGSRAVFLLSGGGMMHLLDAVGRNEGLRYICNHHEQAGAMAAEAYARESGTLGVCYATSGPGGTNTITGVAGAWVDSSPVLFISGQSKLSQTIQGSGIEGLRQFGTFEIDIIPVVKSITKYAAFVSDAKDIRYHLERACFEAFNGRPGPVFLDIPVDIQGALIEPETLRSFAPPASTTSTITDGDLKDVFEHLSKAKRPLILAGHGIRAGGLVDEFRSFVEKYKIPVVTTQLATDLMPYDHPFYVGHPGMKGDRPGNFAIQSADFVLVLGSSLHVLTTGYELDRFSPNSYKVMVEPDEAVMKREKVGVQKKIRADVGSFLSKFSRELEVRKAANLAPDAWIKHCAMMKEDLAVRNEPHKRIGTKPQYYDLIEELSRHARGDETITADAGSAFYVVGQAFRPKAKQRVIISGGLGTMGFALPAATGAAVASPEKNVICVTGDGSLMTNIHELAVIKQNDLNIKVIVVNNDGYVSIRNTQNNFFGGFLVGTSTSSGVFIPNLEKMTESYGLPFQKVEDVKDLSSTIEKLMEIRGPVVCEIMMHSDQDIIPTVTSMKREDGTMESKPIHDMAPFMTPEQRSKYLL